MVPHMVTMSRVRKSGSPSITVLCALLPSSLKREGRYRKATSTPRASGRIVVYDAVVAFEQFLGSYDVFEHVAVFDFRHSDYGGIIPYGARYVEQYFFLCYAVFSNT